MMINNVCERIAPSATRCAVLIILGLCLVVVGSRPAGAGTMSHSGTVVAVDRQSGTIMFDEVGPWHVEPGATAVRRQTVTVIASTTFVRAARALDPPPDGWPGGIVEVLIEPWELEVGDPITVLCLHNGRFVTALEIVVSAIGE